MEKKPFAEIEKVLHEKNLKLDYLTHPTIIDFTGEDAAKERYLAFLAQIINLSETQISKNPDLKPMILIFTPTSWLIPRPAYQDFG